MAAQTGVPIQLIKDCIGLKVKVEASNGDVYTGVLVEAESNMSVSLSNVRTVLVNGRKIDMESIYVKGSKIRLIKLPTSSETILNSLMRSFRQSSFRGKRGGFRGVRERERYVQKSSKPSYERRRY